MWLHEVAVTPPRIGSSPDCVDYKFDDQIISLTVRVGGANVSSAACVQIGGVKFEELSIKSVSVPSGVLFARDTGQPSLGVANPSTETHGANLLANPLNLRGSADPAVRTRLINKLYRK